ncbi:MAG: response regulator transcription factor [Bacteroidota bacterium]|nr:DNA-binding response regulator [Odoribacter sp.]MDP3644306.1 response regulator transcription factor [Bacteroidota bacterium]
MEHIRVLIADDHEVIHNGIGDILKSTVRYKVIGHAYNGEEAIEKAFQLHPDIIFMDISMPKMNGIEATREIRKKLAGTKIIALTQHEENEYVFQFLKAGGDGYLLKNSKKEHFTDAIESVLKNRRYISSELAEQLLNLTLLNNSENPEPEAMHLTRREIEIIRMIADEKSNPEIANELNISLRTVETHRRNLMQKLKVKSVISMLKYAAAHKIIDL